jgi:hypothetical protein
MPVSSGPGHAPPGKGTALPRKYRTVRVPENKSGDKIGEKYKTYKKE